jgi:hypothetical protein
LNGEAAADPAVRVDPNPSISDRHSEPTMYHAFGLLQPDTDFSLEEAEARLRFRFPMFTVARVGDQLSLVAGEWELKVRVNDDPQVATESVGLAGKIAGLEPAEAADMEACTRRVEVWSDTQDPFIEHLSDFQAAIDVLRTFRGIILVDPQEHALL